MFSGPWFIGEVIDGHTGACFAFGVFVDGHFLEGSLTYVVGISQVMQVIYDANHYEAGVFQGWTKVSFSWNLK